MNDLTPNAVRRRAPRAALAALLSALTFLPALSAHAADDASDSSSWRPSRFFLQVGAYDKVQSIDAGLAWLTGFERHWGDKTLNIVTTSQIGRWYLDREARYDHKAYWHIGLTPALRLTWPGESRFHIEAGIGLNVVTPVFHTTEKRFSTAFNFGDHLAVGGLLFGPRAGEWSLRFQHFSNGNIARPNPGQNFVQMRWSQAL
ncbi:MAG: acyloxyacyl hydrolase [Rubrivivax sp.]|nr:MAG: acyloxyacyl hydrolase [Rubrivivax sp.]